MSVKNTLDLTISIVSYNTKNHLKACLDSIYKYTKSISYEVFVVDNGSTDGSVEMVKKEFPEVKLIKNNKNLFFTIAHNQAIKKSQGKYVLILNSDTTIHKNTLKKVLSFLYKNPSIGALGIKHILPDKSYERTCQKFTTPMDEFFHSHIFARFLPKNKQYSKLFYSSWDRKTSREVEAVSDACLFSPREILKEIGFYDERFFLFFTENDLCYKIKQIGYQSFYYADASITHIRSQSVQKLKSKKAYSLYEHDMLEYYKKYFGSLWWIILWILYIPNRLYWNLYK